MVPGVPSHSRFVLNGTTSSNPAPSSGKSANHRFRCVGKSPSWGIPTRFAAKATSTNSGQVFDEAVACLRDALAGRLGAMVFRPYGFTRLAEALARQGEHGPFLAAVREGIKAQEETGARHGDAQLHRLQGIALLGLNRVERAKAPSKKRCASHEDVKQRPMSCAPRRPWRGSGANRADGLRLPRNSDPRRWIHVSNAGSATDVCNAEHQWWVHPATTRPAAEVHAPGLTGGT